MAATNLTPGTALNIGPFPSTTTILAADVNGAPTGTGYASTCDATQRHALWFSYTTGSAESIIAVGIEGAESGDAYHPVMSVWTGTPPAVTQHKVLNATGGLLNNLCASFALASNRTDTWWFSFPVAPSTTYYFQVTDANSTTVTTNLVVRGQSAPIGTALPGDILIINDAGPFPGAVVSPQTGAIKAFYANLGNGEEGAGLQTGETAFQATNLNTPNGATQIVSRTLGDIATVNLNGEILASATDFYVLTSTGTTCHVNMVHPDGSLGPVVDVPHGTTGLMVSKDGSIYYYVDDSTFTLVKRWDLVHNVAMSDFAGAFPGSPEPLFGFISGQTQTVVVVYSGAPNVMRTFSTTGTLLTTTNLGMTVSRLIGDLLTDTFQVWDGNVTFGRYGIWAPNTPVQPVVTAPGSQSSNGGPQHAPFAVSTSCPLLIVPSAAWAGQQFFVGTEFTTPMVRKRRVPFPVLSGSRNQFVRQIMPQIEKGQGILGNPTTPARMQIKLSVNNGETWGTERSLSIGQTGAYSGRVYANLWPYGRYPVVELTVSDNTNAVLTDIQTLIDAGDR